MRIALFSAACLACGMASAATPVDGWYSSIFGGYTYFPDNLTRTIDNQLFNGASYRSGYNVGGRVGYQSNPLRYEGEFTYLHGDLKNYFINQNSQVNVDGYTAAYLIMANIYYDFPEMVPAVAPFVGIGIGYANVEGLYETLPPNAPAFLNGSDGLFAYQGTAGLTYNFSENYALNLSYRYVGTDRADQLGKVFEAHVGSVGVIYRFDNCYK